MNFSYFLEIIEPVIDFSVPYLEIGLEIFKKWFWIILPFVLWKPALFQWKWWREDIWDKKQKAVLLEIKIPREILKPMRAMETVFSGLWQAHATPTWIEEWWDGQMLTSFSFEIIAIDGTPHFLIRCPVEYQNVLEAHIYSQFPEAEIFEVEDYAKKVPQDIPNKDWDIWATDYRLNKDESAYPIKTYRDFETEREAKEEKRIDPMAALLESMAKLKKGEQIWVQIRAKPVLEENVPWGKRGKEIIDELVHRSKPKKKKFFLLQIFEILAYGSPEKEESKEEMLPPEMKLTPGEKEVVAGIERKIGKLGFQTYIRFIYLAKKEVFFKPNLKLAMSYFTNFVTENLAGPVPASKTITKTRRKWHDVFWFPNRRLYLKKRISFRKYVKRLPYFYPLDGGTFILNTEELATIYHFPSRVLTPASLLPRVEAKKGEAPLELPVEDMEED